MDVQELISKRSDLERAISKSIQELIADFKLDTGMDITAINIGRVNVPVRWDYIYERSESSEKLKAIVAANETFQVLSIPVKIRLGI